MELKITLNVASKGEAYNIVSELGFEHEVTEAELDGKKENLQNKKTSHFLKENPSPNNKYKDKDDMGRSKKEAKTPSFY